MSAKRTAPLVLGSSSPRRRELLQQLGLQFEVVEPDPDDDPADHRPAVEFARALAERKALSVAHRPEMADRLVLGADTVVFDEDRILLKAADRDEARQMLTRISGATHRVVTALALVTPAASAQPSVALHHDVTAVTFAELSTDEIESYLDTDEWKNVAGAYRIQGRGAALVEYLEGTYSTVVGLPIRLLYSMLRNTSSRVF